MMNEISIEIFCAPNCNRCSRAVKMVEEIVKTIDSDSIIYRKINIIEEIDHAVELGIRATPAIVINGKLEFTATPDKKILEQKIMQLRQ